MSKEPKEIEMDPEAKAILDENSKSPNKKALEALELQVKDFKEKKEYYNTMYLKAQGAIEVLLQLEKEVNNDG